MSVRPEEPVEIDPPSTMVRFLDGPLNSKLITLQSGFGLPGGQYKKDRACTYCPPNTDKKFPCYRSVEERFLTDEKSNP